MSKNNWEENWEKHALGYASKINGIPVSNDYKWLTNFLQTAIITTNIFIPSFVTLVSEFKLKLTDFNEDNFEKKLSKTKKNQVEYAIKVFLMDYLSSFMEHPNHILLMEGKKIEKAKFEKDILNFLFFNKKEKKIFEEIKEKKETYYPSISFLESLHIKDESKNEGLLGGIEFIKNEVYNKMDNDFQKFIKSTF